MSINDADNAGSWLQQYGTCARLAAHRLAHVRKRPEPGTRGRVAEYAELPLRREYKTHGSSSSFSLSSNAVLLFSSYLPSRLTNDLTQLNVRLDAAHVPSV
jgi:hypothetical protein